MKRFLTKIAILSVGLFLGGLIFVSASPSAHAASNERMMDDAVFDNSGSMSAGDIQNFLNQFPNSCLKNFSDEYPVDYFTYNGPANTSSGPASAATIIRRAADLWGINPRVILGKLEQEENLVTGNSGCNLYQYVSAVGFNCPGSIRDAVFRGVPLRTCVQSDGAMGFARQVTKGAWTLKFAKERSIDNLGWMVPDDASTYYYGPFVSAGNHKRCGSCATIYHDGYFNGVDVQTGATASFYNYTPFLNQAFDEIYEGWFGSTYAAAYRAAFAGQSGYPAISPGQSIPAHISFKNTGAVAWYDDASVGTATPGTKPVHLATSSPLNRGSQFGATWYGGNHDRPSVNFAAVYEADGTTLAPDQHIVRTGQIAKFSFIFTATPSQGPGTFRESFNPIAEGNADNFNDVGAFLNVTVKQGYLASFAGQSGYPAILQGQSKSEFIKYKNEGASAWYDDVSLGGAPVGTKPVHLATTSPINRASVFGNSWVGGNRDRPSTTFAKVYEPDGTTLAANQHVVQPGQIARFDINFSAPTNLGPGSYREQFNPVLEGVGPFNPVGAFLDVAVQSATYAQSFAGQSIYPTIQRGNSFTGFIQYKNTGNVAWYDDATAAVAGVKPIHLATASPINRTSIFGNTWAGGNHDRPATTFAKVFEADGTTLAANQHVVQPGQIARFNIVFTTSGTTPLGTFREKFQAIVEGGSVMNDIGAFLDVTVTQ